MADQGQSEAASAANTGSEPPTGQEQQQQQAAEEQQQQQREEIVPGPRATRLKALYSQALTHTLSKLAWNNFATCYPTISSRSESVLKQVQAQMVAKLSEKCEVGSLPFRQPTPTFQEANIDWNDRKNLTIL